MNTFKLVIAVLLWIVTFWRLPAAVRRPQQRSTWLAFTGLAIATTIAIPPIALAIDTGTGINDLCVLIKNVIGVGACAAVLDLVIAMARPDLLRRSRRFIAAGSAAAATLLTVLFLQVPRQVRVDNFYEGHAASHAATGYCLTFVAYLALATAFGSWLCLGYGRKSGRSFLRAGLQILGFGLAVGTVYSLFRTSHLSARLLDLPFPMAEATAQYTADTIEYAAIFLIIIGNSLAPLGALVRAGRDWRSLRAIRPLWTSLTSAVPDIVLGTRVRRGPRIRLHRVVIEIRDAALVLSPYADAGTRERARAAARRTGLAGEALETAAQALWLRAAAEARARGAAPAPAEEPAAQASDGLDFEAEVARLRQLTAFYHSPAAEAFAAGIHEEPGAEAGAGATAAGAAADRAGLV
ncbi:MAB_1171c family putative transporter [Streptomyces sp. NBC_00239]|uniref:MAB_1171c family putative transporter n=1 Tax=Streptomyces sp. NBC_00239 TaxID=2903640 RepID=UPI002E27FF26|nr:MAB_1171c family putative transporter [Streptomyces sp. NBC_00239]